MAKVDKSPRLQAIASFLSERGTTGATTWELCQACHTTNPARDISELKAQGFNIECEYEGKSDSGRKIYRYELLPF